MPSALSPTSSNAIKRVRKACSNCRRKKARCSGERPRCNFCARLSQTCTYVDKSPPVTAKVTGSLTGTTDSHVCNQLAVRVAVLEAKLNNLTNNFIQYCLSLVFPTELEKAWLTECSSPVTANPESNVGFPDAAPPSIQGSDVVVSYESMPNDAVNPILQQLPPRVLEGLIDTYFYFCHNQPYSFFHEESFRQRLANGSVPDHLVLAFAATALRFSTDEFFAGEQQAAAAKYATIAWKSLVLTWMAVDEEPRLDIVQAITLLSVVDFTAGKLHPAWMKIGLSVRIAQDLRLMLEPSASLTDVDQEEHRRAFWSVYLLDKLVSVGRARPPAILDEDCQVRLPDDDATFRTGSGKVMPTIQQLRFGECSELSNPGHFAVTIMTASVLCSCIRYMLRNNKATREEAPWDSRSDFNVINSRLLDLESRFDLAAPITEIIQRECVFGKDLDQKRAGQLLFSHILFRLSHCILHHPFLLHTRLRSSTSKTPTSFRKLIFQSSLRDSQAITTLLQQAKDAGCNTITSFYGCCLTVAGSVQAIYTQHDCETIRAEAAQSLKATMERLEEIGTYWRHATHMVANLKKFSDDAFRFKQLLYADSQPEFSKQELESLWCLVDYTAMSKERLDSHGDSVWPAWFNFDLDSISGLNNDYQLPADAISRNVVTSLFEEPNLLSPMSHSIIKDGCSGQSAIV